MALVSLQLVPVVLKVKAEAGANANEAVLKDTLEPMKDGFVDRPSTFQVLDDDSLQQPRRYIGVPNALRIDDDNRPVAADTEARRLASLHACRTEEQIFPRQELGEQ